jgi:hypothetical protein
VPIQTRCPSCAAAIPSSAAWCSLCHADLRPPPEPVPVELAGPAEQSGTPETPSSLETAGGGRHAGGALAEQERPRLSSGRHAAGPGRRAPRSAPRAAGPDRVPSQVAVLEGLDLPQGGEATPEQVEAIAEQMLSRLSVTEPQSRVLDPSELPGGKWGLAAACGLGFFVILLVLGTVLGLLTHH